jgi:hypothetical protein
MAKPDTNPRCQAYFAYFRIKSNASVLVASFALSIISTGAEAITPQKDTEPSNLECTKAILKPTLPSLLRVLPNKVQRQRARGILGTEHHL